MDRDQRCTTCGQTFGWHEEHKPSHLFLDKGGALQVPEPRDPAPPPMLRGDLVLRLALLKKGLVSEFELGQAETWMNQAALRQMAVTIVPDEEAGGYRFQLLTFDELIGGSAQKMNDAARAAS